MKTSIKFSPIAVAIAAFCISPLALAGANVDNGQSSTLNVQSSIWNSNTDSTLGGNAAAGSSGNVGINIATGTQNQQGNAGALSSDSNITRSANTTAAVTAGQTELMDYAFSVMNGANLVSLTGNALSGAAGNVGVNMTSGSFNQQQNNLATAYSTYSNRANASTTTMQIAGANMNYNASNFGTDAQASNNTGLYGNVLSDADGNIGVNEAAGISNQQSNSLSVAYTTNPHWENYSVGAVSNVENTQVMGINGAMQGNPFIWEQTGTRNVAGLGQNALQGASGNIGANLASGNSNQQGNSTAISATSDSHNRWHTDYAEATTHANQLQIGNGTMDTNVIDGAGLSGNAAQNASGNININVASGSQNQQQNGLAIASIASAKAMGSASAPIEQVALLNGSGSMCSTYSSTVDGNALQGASGNIGLNVASGNNNQQVNTLAIASVTR